jgi:hypothetical protein
MLAQRRAPRSVVAALAFVGVVALAATCGPIAGGDDDGTGGQQDGGTGPTGPIDQNPNDPNCHEQTFEPEKVNDPDIMIVFDKSGSMADGTPTKYDQTATAIKNAVTSAAAAQIYWGLIFFPSDGSCGIGSAPDVDIGPDGASQIPGVLTGNGPNGSTPAHKAIDLAIQSYNLITDDRAHFILLATDGMPNCEGDPVTLPTYCSVDADCNNPDLYCEPTGMPPPYPAGLCMPKPKDLAINEITLANEGYGIKTYVVGMDIDTGVADTLNRMAEAGGTARSGDTKYYPVSDQASLEQTLTNITMQIISCTFALDQQPPADPSYIGVSVDGTPVPRDPTQTNGWDVSFEQNTITFYGDACATLQSNPAAVSVTFACSPID